jgi:hypothetical protein
MKAEFPFLSSRRAWSVILMSVAILALGSHGWAETSTDSNEPYLDTAKDPTKGGTTNRDISEAGPGKVENATASDLGVSAESSKSSVSGATEPQAAAPTATEPQTAAPRKHKQKKGAAHHRRPESISSMSATTYRKSRQELKDLKEKVGDLQLQVESLQSELSDERARHEAMHVQLDKDIDDIKIALTPPPESQITMFALGEALTGAPPEPTMALREGPSAYIFEPASADPFHVGSTSVTGKDKSVAVLERNDSPFVDSQARALALAGRNATKPLKDINFQDYTYSQRGRFASDMNSRLNKIDRDIDVLRARVGSSAGDVSRADAVQKIYDLQTMQAKANATLKGVSGVHDRDWEPLKSKFRSELSALEGAYQAFSASIR